MVQDRDGRTFFQVGAGWLVTGSQEAKDTPPSLYFFFARKKKWKGGLIKDWLRQPCKAATIFFKSLAGLFISKFSQLTTLVRT